MKHVLHKCTITRSSESNTDTRQSKNAMRVHIGPGKCQDLPNKCVCLCATLCACLFWVFTVCSKCVNYGGAHGKEKSMWKMIEMGRCAVRRAGGWGGAGCRYEWNLKFKVVRIRPVLVKMKDDESDSVCGVTSTVYHFRLLWQRQRLFCGCVRTYKMCLCVCVSLQRNTFQPLKYCLLSVAALQHVTHQMYCIFTVLYACVFYHRVAPIV